MKVLVVGSGGREHALAWKLAQSPRLAKLFVLPGSDAMAGLGERLAADPLDGPAVAARCAELAIDLVVVGPEAPLAAGLCDELRARGIAAFGPGREGARLESSKARAKEFMRRHRIPTARFEVYDDPARALDAAAELPIPLVVKADGLAAGKGVRVCATRREALRAVADLMARRTSGEAGARVVLEECLRGPEATVMAFCDGKRLLPLPVSRDFKRLKDLDLGPNTGGMGAFAPAPLGSSAERRLREEVLDRTLAGLEAEGIDYRGLLYFGIMLTEDGPKVLEFNARFGDPETQAVLPLLRSDLLELCAAAAAGDLSRAAPEILPGSAVTVVLASEGYPESPVTGQPIEGLDAAGSLSPALPSCAEEGDAGGVFAFHAGTTRAGGGWVTAGGRVLAVTATGPTLASARERAYSAAGRVRFEGLQLRRDVAQETAPSAAEAVG